MDSRKQNGLLQKIFLVKMEYNKSNNEVLFHILGNSSHVYKIKYNTNFYSPKCSCPDSTFRKVTCKHIHFLSNKVLGEYKNNKFTPDSLHLFYQSTLERLPHLKEIYSKDCVELYNEVVDDAKTIVEPKPRNTDCCICLELLDKVHLTVCKVCKNGIHKVCWDKWRKFSKTNTCTFCRSKKQKENDSFTDCLGNLKL